MTARQRERFGQRGDYPLPKLIKAPGGGYLCRWCEGPVERPRLYWCSEACVLEYRMRADWNFIREQIIKRDKVCRACGQARYSCIGGKKRARTGWEPRQTYMIGGAWWRDDGRGIIWGPFNAVELRWEVDHILPVSDGGTDDPANLRLLCLPCHKERTKQWHRQRAAGPQAALPLD